MDAFFCITLSTLLIRWWWKNNKHNKTVNSFDRKETDELISVIIPTINKDK